MSDVPMHPQQPAPGHDPYGQPNPADPNAAGFGAPPEDQSWLLDDGPEPALDPLPYEAVQALPEDLADAPAPSGEEDWLALRADEPAPPEAGVEPEEAALETLESYDEHAEEEELAAAGMTSYVEPEPKSRPLLRAALPGAAALLLSFGGIAFWSSMRSAQSVDDEVEVATVVPERATGSRSRVQLADPEGGAETTQATGRMQLRNDGSAIPVGGQRAPSIGRAKTVDSPREPGELGAETSANRVLSTAELAAAFPSTDDGAPAEVESPEAIEADASAAEPVAETSELTPDEDLALERTGGEADPFAPMESLTSPTEAESLDLDALDGLVLEVAGDGFQASGESEVADLEEASGMDAAESDPLAAALSQISTEFADEPAVEPLEGFEEDGAAIGAEPGETLASLDAGVNGQEIQESVEAMGLGEDSEIELVAANEDEAREDSRGAFAVDDTEAHARLDAIFGTLETSESAEAEPLAALDRIDEDSDERAADTAAPTETAEVASEGIEAAEAVDPVALAQPTMIEPAENEPESAASAADGPAVAAATPEPETVADATTPAAESGLPASPFGPVMAMPPAAEPTAASGAESTSPEASPKAEQGPTLVESEPVEVEVRGSIAGEGPRKKLGSVLVRADDDSYWQHKSVPKGRYDAKNMVLTPNVGNVRVVFDGGETIDGRLHAVGQNKLVLDTQMGRMTLDARRADRVDRLTAGATRSLASPSTTGSTAGLKRVRVRAKGGTFYGHLVSNEDGKVTLLLDEGFKLTLESDDVTEVAGSARLRRIDSKK